MEKSVALERLLTLLKGELEEHTKIYVELETKKIDHRDNNNYDSPDKSVNGACAGSRMNSKGS